MLRLRSHNTLEAKTRECPVSKADRIVIVRWTKRLGLGAVVFFTIKGLAWIGIAVLIAMGVIGR